MRNNESSKKFDKPLDTVFSGASRFAIELVRMDRRLLGRCRSDRQLARNYSCPSDPSSAARSIFDNRR